MTSYVNLRRVFRHGLLLAELFDREISKTPLLSSALKQTYYNALLSREKSWILGFAVYSTSSPTCRPATVTKFSPNTTSSRNSVRKSNRCSTSIQEAAVPSLNLYPMLRKTSWSPVACNNSRIGDAIARFDYSEPVEWERCIWPSAPTGRFSRRSQSSCSVPTSNGLPGAIGFSRSASFSRP